MSNGSGASYGNDVIDGGDGVDTLDFGAAARTAVFVDLSCRHRERRRHWRRGQRDADQHRERQRQRVCRPDHRQCRGELPVRLRRQRHARRRRGQRPARRRGGQRPIRVYGNAGGGERRHDYRLRIRRGQDRAECGLNLGANGNFAAGDARFNSERASTPARTRPTASSTTRRRVSSGTTPTATAPARRSSSPRCRPRPALTATDIVALNSTGTGQQLTGTPGNDSIAMFMYSTGSVRVARPQRLRQRSSDAGAIVTSAAWCRHALAIGDDAGRAGGRFLGHLHHLEADHTSAASLSVAGTC